MKKQRASQRKSGAMEIILSEEKVVLSMNQIRVKTKSTRLDEVVLARRILSSAFKSKPDIVDSLLKELEHMENNNRMLKELAIPDSWCIQYPYLESAQSYKLKSGLIHLLPKFHGLVGEDPHKHLKEFHVVCSMMRLQGILEDYMKMKPFLFYLDRAAKD
ncbi:hypothetical protein CR513_45434, partial [Mucuna pruriens]